MATNKEIQVGADALKSFIAGINWFEAQMIPADALHTGSKGVIEAMDACADQSPHGRHAAGQGALRKMVDATGYGGMVSDQMCAGGAVAIDAAVLKLRGVKPTPQTA